MSRIRFNTKQFRETRRSNKIRQWDLTKVTGVPQSKISLIENDFIRPSREERQKLQKGLETLVGKHGA
jgi:predicted transcriptional regulator